MADVLSPENLASTAEALQSNPQSVAIPTPGEAGDFVARIGRTAASTFSPALQGLAQLEGSPELADYFRKQRLAQETNQIGDVLPTNPELDNSIQATVANTIGSAGPRAGLLALTGGIPGMALLAGETVAANSALVPEQQAAYDAAAEAAIARGEEPTGERPTLAGANTEGLGTLGAFALLGPAAARLAMPAIASLRPAIRPIAGVGVNALSNVGMDLGIRAGTSAITGKPIIRDANDLAAMATGGAIFGVHPGIEQARGVQQYQFQQALKKFQDALKKASTTEVVAPGTPPPENVDIKPATETETGVAVSPPKEAPALTPTTALPHELQLNPNSALAVEQTSTKEPQVVVTPKKESTETKTEPATPTVLEPADRLKVIDEEMEKIREESGVGDDGQLSIASPETQATFDALAAERMKLALGEEPTKGPQPVTGLERPKVENAPPPFTSEEAAPEVAFPETQKAPKVTQADVTEVVKPEERVAPESDITKLTDDQLESQESIARQTNDQATFDRIDTEIARRAALGETPAGEERVPGTEPAVAEDTQRGAGVPGDAAVTGERGQEPVPGLTPEESAELDALWKKSKATKADLDRIDELQAKIPDLPNGVSSSSRGPEELERDYGVPKEILERANKHVVERIAPAAARLASEIAGEPVELIIGPSDHNASHVNMDKNGKITLTVDPNFGALIRSFKGGNDFRASAAAKKYLSEEMVHVAEFAAIKKLQKTKDPNSTLRPDAYVLKYTTDIIRGIKNKLDSLAASGDKLGYSELASRIRSAKIAYDKAQTSERAGDLLDKWSKNPEEALTYAIELDRQLQQARITGQTTESVYGKALQKLHDLVKLAIEHIKGSLGFAEKGGFGPEFSELYQNTKKQLGNKGINIKEAIPTRTLDALDGLKLRYDGVMEGFGKVKSFNLFTPTDLPPDQSTTFAAPFGVSKENLAKIREKALRPFNERTSTDTTGLPEAPPAADATQRDRGEDNGPMPIPGLAEANAGQLPAGATGETSAIRADVNGVREIPPQAGAKASVSGGPLEPGEPNQRRPDSTPIDEERINPANAGAGGKTPPPIPTSGGATGGESGGNRGEPNGIRANVDGRSDGRGNAGGSGPNVGQTPKEGTFLEKAFDKIKNLPIISKVSNSSIAKRIGERLKPSIQDLRESVEAKFRGMEFLKNNAATQVKKGIAIAFGHNKEDMAAAYPILEAGGGRIGDADGPTAQDVRLEVQLQLENGRKALDSPVVSDAAKETIRKFLPAYEKALADFDRLIPGVKRVKEAFDDAFKLRQSVDPDAHYIDDYVGRIYELNKQRGDSPLPPESLIGGGKSGITSFDKSRKYDTIMDAMIGRKTDSGTWESETPKSFDVADLAANHTAVSNDIVSNKLLQDTFETTSYPGTNEPLFVPKPKVGESLPPNYVRIDGPFKQPVFVYHAIADLFKSIYGESQLRNSDAGNALLKASGAIKHGTLALDTFHLSRVYQKAFMEAVASGDWRKVADFKKNMPSYTEQGQMGKYLGTLDVAPRDVDAAIKAGELTPEDGAFIKGEGAVLKKRGEDGGLLAGRFTDNLWKEASGLIKTVADAVHFPQAHTALEQFNNFTFARVTKAAMFSAFESRIKRIDKDFPELTEHQRNIKAAKEINEQFGNIGRSGILKSKTAQDYAQLFMLAPNWVQSQVMAEARQYGQGARALFDATVGKKLPNGERERVLRVGNSARFLATTSLSVFAANQVINLATRGRPTWQNEEEGHKFDAWIPGGKDGFFYSPIALASEYASHLKNYGKYESLPSSVAHIASNKLSPLASAAKIALTQKDYTGKKLSGVDLAKAVVKQAAPIPIIGSSAIKGADDESKAGTTQQNLLRSAGVATERAPDAVAMGYQAFAPYRTKDRPDTGPSDYKPLKTLVQNGETPEKIKAEVDRLKKSGKKIEDIRRSFDFKNLSGSLANDLRAIKEKPELAKIRQAAIAQKKAEADALKKALQTK